MTWPVESTAFAVVVAQENDGVRLDVFLARATGLGRRAAVRMATRCRVNGRRAPKSLVLRAGDRVEVANGPTLESREFVPPRILAEKREFLALAKPAGLPSVALVGGEGPSVAQWLALHYPECATCGGPGESGLVHRLDSGTSGVLLAARTQTAYTWFRAGFAAHLMHKTYHCLVEGDLDAPVQIDLPIGQHRKSSTRVRALPSGRTRRYRRTEARTEVRPIERFGDHTLIEAATSSGARHQIRVHLSAVGHPLLGDTRYGASDQVETTGFFLHASRIEWSGHDGGLQSLSAPTPEAFTRYIEALRISSTSPAGGERP